MEHSYTYLAEYVSRASTGDSDAFAQLYSMTYNSVYNYARHYMRDDYLAQDAVQEIYISALKNLSKLNDPTLFLAWLKQISFHVCYDMCKSRKQGYGEVSSEMMEDYCNVVGSDSPETDVLSTDESERLMKAVEKLPATEREVVTLRYYNNMKIDDIVSATGLSKSTVKRHLNTALEKLKLIMKE